jgi:hypothetical protein
MNELEVCTQRGGPHYGYTTVLGNPYLGDYGHFQPGPGNSMGYDDLKVVEAKKFLAAVLGGEQVQCSIDDALSAAQVVSAAVASAESGTWHAVTPIPGVRYGGTRQAQTEAIGV